jgi:ATP-binding cassette, subfamily B, bacterial MsbA
MIGGRDRFFRKQLKQTQFWQEHDVILREFRYFPRLVILALVFTLCAAVFEGFGIGFIVTFLQNLTNPTADPIRTGLDWFDRLILGVDAPLASRIYRTCGLILLTTWLRAGFTFLGQSYSQKTQLVLGDRLRKRLFEQMQALSLQYFAKQRAGDLINGITSEIYQIMQAFNVVSTLLIQGSTLLVYVISMLVLSWQLTLISILLYSLLAVAMANLLGWVREASFERSKASRWYTSVALEFINGIRTVQAFAAQDFERRRFYDASEQLLTAATKSVTAISLVGPLTEAASVTLLVGILILAFATLAPGGQLQSASLLAFLFVLFRSTPLLRQLNSARGQLSSFQGSLGHVKELLRTDDKVYLQNGDRVFEQLRQGIEFRAVNFDYEPGEPLLRQINLTIERGQMTALVGASGAGKSTLVDLIPRFYDPTTGTILIDGVDLRSFDINSVRRQLAVVSQDTFIFNDSVRNNIAYALEDVDDRAIWQAARLANALEFIQELPQGFDTQLGDRGVRLSGGQRQRIAIARALLRNPDILILDEATSALDSVTERLIQSSLETLSAGRTVIVIAHRLSTIVRADKVIVLEQGQIVEQGGYQELLDRRGKLWNYHQMQYELSQVG